MTEDCAMHYKVHAHGRVRRSMPAIVIGTVLMLVAVVQPVAAEGASEGTLKPRPHNELKVLQQKYNENVKQRRAAKANAALSLVEARQATGNVGEGSAMNDPATAGMSPEEAEEYRRIQSLTQAADKASEPERPPCKENVVEDVPLPPPIDPKCELIQSCSDCLKNRKCGWCQAENVCKNAKNPDPLCVHNDDINVCPKLCPDMFQLNAPIGRGAVVDKLCSFITIDFKNHPPKPSLFNE